MMGPNVSCSPQRKWLPVSGCATFGKWGCGSQAGAAGCRSPCAWAVHPPDRSPFPLRCSNLERRQRPSHSALACWSTHRPQGSPPWKPAPTASLMNCDVMEPSSPTTARFPRSSISVLEVRAQLGKQGAGRAGNDCGGGLGVKDRTGMLGAVLGRCSRYRRPKAASPALCGHLGWAPSAEFVI